MRRINLVGTVLLLTTLAGCSLAGGSSTPSTSLSVSTLVTTLVVPPETVTVTLRPSTITPGVTRGKSTVQSSGTSSTKTGKTAAVTSPPVAPNTLILTSAVSYQVVVDTALGFSASFPVVPASSGRKSTLAYEACNGSTCINENSIDGTSKSYGSMLTLTKDGKYICPNSALSGCKTGLTVQSGYSIEVYKPFFNDWAAAMESASTCVKHEVVFAGVKTAQTCSSSTGSTVMILHHSDYLYYIFADKQFATKFLASFRLT